jgi:hypothetical protein
MLGQAARSASPTLIGTLTYLSIEAAKDTAKYRRGEIDGEQLADGMMRKSVVATVGAYGAGIGQVLIPIPIVGAMIGATLGSIVAGAGYQFLDTAAEAFFRSDQLRDLARITCALADEWDAFLRDYDRWKAARAWQTARLDALHERIDARAEQRGELDRALLDDLEDDT